jgi:hypothetical protein
MNDYAFLYTDFDYFAWFAQKTKDNLENVLSWKQLRQGRHKINNIMNKLWDNKHQKLNLNLSEIEDLPVTSRAFLYHLNNHIKYPIFDSNVHRAMRELCPDYRANTRKSSYTWSHYKDHYIRAFDNLYNEQQNNLVPIELPHINDIDKLDKELVKRRMLDRALWSYGKVLARRNGHR